MLFVSFWGAEIHPHDYAFSIDKLIFHLEHLLYILWS